MKRLIIILCFLLTIPAIPVFSSDFAPNRVIEKIDAHSVAVLVYFAMSDEEYAKRVRKYDSEQPKTYQVLFFGGKDSPIKYVAYVGAGTVLKENYIITVAHLFSENENTLGMQVFVMPKNTAEHYGADLIVRTQMKYSYDDYAIVKTRKDMGLPGIKVSAKRPSIGDKVIYVGTTEGVAFNRRFGFLSSNQQFFYRGTDDEALHLGFWEPFEYYMVTNGGAGDSGGGIFNTNGELVGIMYCGVDKAHTPVYSNPLEILWGFLERANMTWLGYDKRMKFKTDPDWKQGQTEPESALRRKK